MERVLCMLRCKETIYFHCDSERSSIIIIVHLSWDLVTSVEPCSKLHSEPGNLFPKELGWKNVLSLNIRMLCNGEHDTRLRSHKRIRDKFSLLCRI